MGIQREFASALRGEFGSANATPIYTNSTVASATGEGILHSLGYGAVYGFTILATANQGGLDFRLIDATATGVQTPVIFNLNKVELGTKVITFPRPLEYTRGLCWHTSATGTAATQLYLHWTPFGKIEA